MIILGRILLNEEFVVFYPLMDSLSGEVSSYPSTLATNSIILTFTYT